LAPSGLPIAVFKGGGAWVGVGPLHRAVGFRITWTHRGGKGAGWASRRLPGRGGGRVNGWYGGAVRWLSGFGENHDLRLGGPHRS